VLQVQQLPCGSTAAPTRQPFTDNATEHTIKPGKLVGLAGMSIKQHSLPGMRAHAERLQQTCRAGH
jgi:hypothetical protein